MNKQKEIEQINRCISELVYDKVGLRKAYNYYHCKRDADQFKYLQDNFGLGSPVSVGFTPLMKKHIDVLVGEYLELEPEMQVTCKDEDTISKIQRDKKLKIDSEISKFLNRYLRNALIDILMNSKEPINDPFIEKELEKIKNNVEESFESDFEIAAQNILDYIRHSREIDLRNKLREMFTDLLIGGCCYYRVRPSSGGDNLQFDVLNPIDTFIERNPNSFFLNKSRRAVIRRWLTKDEILEEYGDELTDEAINKVEDYFADMHQGNNLYDYVVVNSKMDSLLEDGSTVSHPTPGILAGLEVHPLYPYTTDEWGTTINTRVIPVFECQWLEFDRKLNRSVLHEGVKIGGDVFITNGEPDYYIRSKSDPHSCKLNINGMFFNDKNGQPFSLIQSTMFLQDRYDLLIYYRDNLIATSGTVGDWVDAASLPEFLGVEMPERVQKWIAYKKNGLAWYDSSQEGAQLINTTFNGYDDTVKAQSIQAIQYAIDSLEQQASSISGVFAQKLGQIQEREAASNVKVGIHQSTLLTKQYFHAMDLMNREVCYDLLNLAKFVFKKGLTGAIILGEGLVKTFTALPEHFTMTDFDLHISDSSENYMKFQTAQQLNVEFVKGGLVDAEMAFDIIDSKSLTEAKRRLNTAVKLKKAENNMLGQLQQQVQQYESDLKQNQKTISDLQNEIKRLQSQVEATNQAKLEIEQKKVEIQEKEANDKKDYNDKLIGVKEKQLTAEMMQIRDGNPYNDQIRDV